MILSLKVSCLVEYFAFFSMRKAANHMIFVYLEFYRYALWFPFWVKISHGILLNETGLWQAMKYRGSNDMGITQAHFSEPILTPL
jgi:hypothetical protein